MEIAMRTGSVHRFGVGDLAVRSSHNLPTFRSHALHQAHYLLGLDRSRGLGAKVEFVALALEIDLVGALLLLGGAQGVFVGKVLKYPKYATDLMIGGILAGVTRAVKMVLPNQFSTCGLGEDMEGLGDYIHPGVGVVTPNGQFVQHLNGFGAYIGPSNPLTGTHGLGDEAMYHQVQPTNVIQLDGMADAEISRELAMQS